MPFPTFSQSGVSTIVTFTTGVTSPAAIEWLTQQSWQMSDAGIPYVYTFGAALELWSFGFANMTQDTLDDLFAFLNAPQVNRRENAFIYTDHAGVKFYVQLYDDRLQFQRLAIGTYNVALRVLHRADLGTPP